MQSVIREKKFAQEGQCQTHGPNVSAFPHLMGDLLNVAIDNYSAFPILVDGVAHFVIVLCNRKHFDKELLQGHQLTHDEQRLVQFVANSFQSVAAQIKTIEHVSAGEGKFRLLAKVQRLLLRAPTVERAQEIFSTKGLAELYPGWISHHKIFLSEPTQSAGSDIRLKQAYPSQSTNEDFASYRSLGLIGESAY